MTISLYIQPNAKRTGIAGKHGEHVKVAVKEPPAEGRANEAVASFAAETLKLPKSAVIITRGKSSRLKTISFDEADASKEGIAKLLGY